MILIEIVSLSLTPEALLWLKSKERIIYMYICVYIHVHTYIYIHIQYIHTCLHISVWSSIPNADIISSLLATCPFDTLVNTVCVWSTSSKSFSLYNYNIYNLGSLLLRMRCCYYIYKQPNYTFPIQLLCRHCLYYTYIISFISYMYIYYYTLLYIILFILYMYIYYYTLLYIILLV